MQNTSPLQPEAAAPRAVYEVPSLALLERFIEASESAADDDDEEGSGFLDHPVYFCPFCGTKLQTPEEVEAKAHDA